MYHSTTANMRRKLAIIVCRNAHEHGIEHVENGRGATVAVRHSVTTKDLTIDERLFAGQTSLYTLSFNNKQPDVQGNSVMAIDALMDYLSDDSMSYTANDAMTLYSNQAEREAYVLAVIGNEMVVEYEMPRGSSALVYFLVKNGELTNRRSIAYKSVPKKWLDAIREADMTEWLGNCQRNGHVEFPKAA